MKTNNELEKANFNIAKENDVLLSKFQQISTQKTSLEQAYKKIQIDLFNQEQKYESLEQTKKI
jgi:hypothetical protein